MMFDETKIIVIGCCGSGKTTFSKRLSAITGLPLYHLDNLYWRPDKSHLDYRSFLKAQKKIMKSDRWILDGNYGRTMKYRIRKSELIFFFDLPADVCLEGVQKREKSRDDIACELSPDDEFLNYIRSFEEITKPNIIKRLQKHPKKKVVCFHSHKEADDFLNDL